MPEPTNALGDPPAGYVDDAPADLFSVFQEHEDYESFAQLLENTDVTVRGQIIGIGQGRRSAEGSNRVFLVAASETIHGSLNSAELLFEDGSYVLSDGRSVGAEGLPWLTIGDEVYLFLAEGEATSNDNNPTYEPTGAYSVALVDAETGSLNNAPRLGDGQLVASDVAEIEAAIAIAKQEISSGVVPDLVTMEELAILAETPVGPTVTLGTAIGADDMVWDLQAFATETGFCWVVTPSGTDPQDDQWLCPSFESVEAALSQSQPVVLRANSAARSQVTHRRRSSCDGQRNPDTRCGVEVIPFAHGDDPEAYRDRTRSSASTR